MFPEDKIIYILDHRWYSPTIKASRSRSGTELDLRNISTIKYYIDIDWHRHKKHIRREGGMGEWSISILNRTVLEMLEALGEIEIERR